MSKFYCLFGGRFDGEASLKIVEVDADSIGDASELAADLAADDPSIEYDLWVLSQIDLDALNEQIKALKATA